MTWLCENPIPIVVLGIIATLSLLVIMFQTGQRGWLYAAIAALAMTLLLVGIERYVVTDREQIVQRVYQGAALVNNNQFAQCGPLFDPTQQVKFNQYLKRITGFKFSECRILRYELEIDAEQANSASMNVLCRVNVEGKLSYAGLARVKLNLIKIKDQWYIISAEWNE